MPVVWFLERQHEIVLAYLALNARPVMRVEHAATEIWPDRSVKAAVNRFYETGHRIREQLKPAGVGDDFLVIARGYMFLDPTLRLDTDMFLKEGDGAPDRAERRAHP